MSNPATEPQGLVAVLTDIQAPLHELDDAAMDLSAYEEALPTLIKAALNLSEDEVVAASLGETIAELWVKVGGFDPVLASQMHPTAQRESSNRFDVD